VSSDARSSTEQRLEQQAAARDAAVAADESDPIGFARDRFSLPDEVIYLDGNSLGAMPKAVPGAVSDALHRQWATDLITSWNTNDWWTLPGRIGDRIGELVGAAPGQLMCGDSTSIQLFQVLSAAAAMRPDRTVLITDGASFPTDQYMADSVAAQRGLDVVRLDPADLGSRLDDRTAVVSFSHVDYRTGELFDMAAITRQVHEAGAIMVWDLCHSAGALPIALDAAQADFAVGCTYKYLNGGPGSPAYIYIASRHLDAAQLPLTGWHGHREPFALEQRYVPAPSVDRARIGTPPVLSMLACQAALSCFDGVSLEDIRQKSLAITDHVIAYADSELAGFGVEVVTPREHGQRGSQVSLRMPPAYEVCQALIARGVIGDFRAPDLLRLGFTPLYLRYVDVHDALQTLRDVLANESYREPAYAQRAAVT
jgi:kynureninase